MVEAVNMAGMTMIIGAGLMASFIGIFGGACFAGFTQIQNEEKKIEEEEVKIEKLVEAKTT